jgi:hypothetical protein
LFLFAPFLIHTSFNFRTLFSPVLKTLTQHFNTIHKHHHKHFSYKPSSSKILKRRAQTPSTTRSHQPNFHLSSVRFPSFPLFIFFIALRIPAT